MSLDRARVWKQLGAPADQEGSVNDPRAQVEHGVTWNEKWIYLDEDGKSVERVVLWNRYDLVGVSHPAGRGFEHSEEAVFLTTRSDLDYCCAESLVHTCEAACHETDGGGFPGFEESTSEVLATAR